MRNVRWMGRAACQDKPQEWFFPPEKMAPADVAYVTSYGLATCATCPVVEDCKNYGQGERYGLWGGLTPDKRKP